MFSGNIISFSPKKCLELLRITTFGTLYSDKRGIKFSIHNVSSNVETNNFSSFLPPCLLINFVDKLQVKNIFSPFDPYILYIVESFEKNV